MKKKILFTDMDGTLLRNDSTVSGEMKAALHRMTQAGHILVLTSGRHPDSILEVAGQAGLIYPGTLIISLNGSLIYDCTAQRPLIEHTVPMEIAAEIMETARRHEIHFHTFTDHEIVCDAEDEEIRYYRRRIHLPLLLSPDPLSLLSHAPHKLHCIHLTDKERLTALQKEVEERFGNTITAQFSNDQYLEFYNASSGKGNAILRVCELFQVPIADSIAAGDAPNDISMLKAAGIGVAMANADMDVKKAADYVTAADNEHDGLIEVIERFLM